ncbi:MAG: sugar ABC transporter ATP-binding protein, partial [Clostridiales bacterium]|nr:sugar ABC transporter ATP-binding protein [Clostridiales bacterium]
YDLMDRMRKEGKSILMISEEIMELLGMSDRIIIMRDGEVSGEFLRSPELSDEKLIEKMV